MKNICLSIFAVITSTLGVSAQAVIGDINDLNEDYKSATIPIEEKIEKVVADTRCDLVYKQSDRNVIVLYGDRMFLGQGVTLQDNTIRITEQASLLDHIEIYTPYAGIFVLNGMGSLQCESYRGDALRISINGMYDTTLGNVEVTDFTLNMNGSADFKCHKIATGSANLNLNGMGEAEFNAIKADNIDISGNGMVHLTLDNTDTDRLKVSANGTTEVYLTGKAETSTFILTGFAFISRDNFTSKHFKLIDNRQ